MDEAEQDQYEARLKELFDSFDFTGTGSLGQEELTDLCHMLQLEEVAPTLQQALLQDNPLGRVHFDQFKEALIVLLSSTLSNEENFQEPDCSPEAQPKYIKDGKRYGRRSVPELQDSMEEFDELTVIEPEDEGTRSSQVSSRNCEELWKSEEREEYEADGQLRFWNPDDLNASQNVLSPAQDWVEEKLQLVCEDLGLTRDDHLNRKKLLSICEQYGFQNLEKESLEDNFQNLDQDDTMSLQDFFYEVLKHTKPLTPSSSTPYRQLKRHLSMQSFDESGRRTITPSTMTGAIEFRLFSKLDDGTGYGSVEDIIDLWQEEGIENSQAILKALDFNLEGKINLTELAMTLENELLLTKNDVYQAALVSFRSEFRHLLERADQAAREKEKLRSDLEKNERLKSRMASEIDDHHATIERRNEYNLKKLDEEYKERTTALKSDLRKEREQLLQQAGKQRLELEKELEKVKMEENCIRDRLTLSLKENSRLERELLETAEKLIEYETLASKLQRSLDNTLRERFGDLDPSCAEFFRQEDRLAQIKNDYERQRRELQDRIDELQSELEEYRVQGIRGVRPSLKNSLSDEMDSKCAMESDQGIGSEDCPQLNMSIEAEMAIEQMRERHLGEVERLSMELEDQMTHYEEQLKETQCVYEREREVVKQQFKEELQQTEEQMQHLQMQHVEREQEIVKLKEEQQRTEREHNVEMNSVETAFNTQRAQLLEQEAALHLQLEEAKRAYNKEKEELVQKAAELEKEVEMRLAELLRTFQEEKDELEHSFHEQVARLIERQGSEKDELRSELLERHQHELREERKKLETEYNRRLSETEARFAEEYQAAMKKHEEVIVGHEDRLQSYMGELTGRHTEEKAQWEFEKDEIIQESVDAQDRLKEILDKEKSMACGELTQERDLLEKTYKEHLNNSMAEKEQVQKELENVRIAAKEEQNGLSSKILQLENDLQEELKERDEQLRHAEKNVQLLSETIEKLESGHKVEKEQLNSRLLASESLYKEACGRAERKKEDMFVEISRLQSTIHELENEVATLSKIHSDYKVLERDKSDLKNVVCQLQNSSVLLEQEGDVLRGLQKAHEQTVKENVKLVSEISRLQGKLELMENQISKGRVSDISIESEAEDNQTQERLAEGEGNSKVHGDMINNQYKETLADVNLRLNCKTKELGDATEALCQMENSYEDTKGENSHLRKQVLLLQENLNHLSLEYGLVKQSVCSQDIPLPELEEAPGLQMLFAVAKKDNLRLQENLNIMEVKHKEAVENNQELCSEVLWLQAEIQSMEEMAESSLKLENMYEDTRKENDELKMLVPTLQEKISELEGNAVVKSRSGEKDIQTADIHLKSKIKRLEEHTKETEEHAPGTTKFIFQESTMENSHLWAKVKELEFACGHLAQQKDELLEDNLTMQRQLRKQEETAAKSATLPQKPNYREANAEELTYKGKTQERSPHGNSLQAANGEREHRIEGSGPPNEQSEMQKRVELLRCETKNLREENAMLKTELATLEEDGEISHQKIEALQATCEEMREKLETVKKEKLAVQKNGESLKKQLSELKARNQQLHSENAELCSKNTKNQANVQDLNRRLVAFLRQKEKKDSEKGVEERERERCQMKDELEDYRSKMAHSETDLGKMKVHNRFLEQENTLLKQDIETKQLSKCSEIADLKNDISGLKTKYEKLLKGKEALSEELSRCVDKSAKVSYLENRMANMKQEQRSWEQQSQALKAQLTLSHEKIQSLEENLQSVNLQMSRLKSDLRVTQQEKEALKQEVMSLHKQLQNANAKNQVLEMAVHSSGLQKQQKTLYWDDLAQLMEQEQQLLRQENERLQREVQNAKSDVSQSREKLRQLDSTVMSLKHQKHQSQSSMVKALEQEKSSLRRDCDQLQKELVSANKKISQMSSLERDVETIRMENEDLRKKQGKFDEQMLHSGTSVTLSHTQPQQQACATVPREQYLQLQQQLQAAMESRSSDTNIPQASLPEQRTLHADSYRRIGRL
ncbi:hypothetical protein FKM82_016541 [Ascaphus truei]